MYVESCCKNSTSKYEKSNSNIDISRIPHLRFNMLCFHLTNDNTVPNAPKTNKFLETTSGSELRKWYDNIIIKEM